MRSNRNISNSRANRIDWRDQNEWPYDALDHVFLGRAVLDIGRALFDDWSDRDPVAEAINFTSKGTDRNRFRKVQETIREECAFGRLEASIQLSDGTFAAIPGACVEYSQSS